MHTVGWLELNEEERAAKAFKMMFRNINEPFKVGILTRAGVCKTLCPQLPDSNTA